ncbi:MAG: molecular chaperone HtpG [Gammaproteobacteria bacterium]|nr:molecular chaperone HtpG [Gammaproteobacteria bacterium]
MSAETHEFQAETRQLLHLMVHSLYSNKEIFLRELISNASDAADKLRFEVIRAPELLGDDAELAIDLLADKATGTLTVRDNGIGMSREEVIANLGTIAHSGTRKYLESLSGDDAKTRQLIGQFGVGFYSAFIVADRVTVLTRRAGTDAAVRWSSDGQGSYTLGDVEKAGRGTEVTLQLKDDDREFLDPERLRTLVRRYSDHIGLPIRLHAGASSGETINRAGALWARPKAEISDDDYRAFYTHLSHDPTPPLAWSHNRVEGALEYTALLYLPSTAPFDLWDRDHARGVQLYVRRVFILDQAAELLPPYLRFVRGLVDSADLPLNVSREILQSDRVVEKLHAALTKRALDLVEELASDRPDDYAKFWKLFGAVLKEGLVEDAANRERIARLCRFASTAHPDGQSVSLDDYIARMKPDQSGIYYLAADNLATAKASPHLEGFRARGFEVLLLTDRVDEWVALHLTEYAGKPLLSCARGAADLGGKIETAGKTAEQAKYGPVCERLGKLLDGRVESVRLSQRLTESPACLVAPEHGLSRRLEQMLKQAGQSAPEFRPVLEINAGHPLAQRLTDADPTEFADLGELLYGQAVLAEGGRLEDPAGFVKRLNALILHGAGDKPSIIIGG